MSDIRRQPQSRFPHYFIEYVEYDAFGKHAVRCERFRGGKVAQERVRDKLRVEIGERGIKPRQQYAYKERHISDKAYKKCEYRLFYIVVEHYEVFGKQLRHEKRERRAVYYNAYPSLIQLGNKHVRAFGSADFAEKRVPVFEERLHEPAFQHQ